MKPNIQTKQNIQILMEQANIQRKKKKKIIPFHYNTKIIIISLKMATTHFLNGKLTFDWAESYAPVFPFTSKEPI